MRAAITGGAGPLGLHLARRPLEEGRGVRSLDLVRVDAAGLTGAVEKLVGDVIVERAARALVEALGALKRLP